MFNSCRSSCRRQGSSHQEVPDRDSNGNLKNSAKKIPPRSCTQPVTASLQDDSIQIVHYTSLYVVGKQWRTRLEIDPPSMQGKKGRKKGHSNQESWINTSRLHVFFSLRCCFKSEQILLPQNKSFL